MSKFEENLDASISNVLNEAKLSDELYQKYLQFVGALDALPQDQIASDRFTSDIHDQFGRVRPFSSWPTKSSRAKSEKVWLNYNERLQLAQAAKEGGTAPEDPTDDPDFLGQLLDTCVRTSMSMGQLDRKTAFRHCSKQVQRFEHAIRGALTDRGLPKKEVEEFTKQLLKGMANGKQIDMKDLSVEDRQFIQDLQDSLTYRPKSESVVKEDIDDTDEFEPKFTEDGVDAYLIEYWGKSGLSGILISTAEEAGIPGFGLLSSWEQLDYVKENFRDVYDEVAAQVIVQLNESTIKEDIDDKDEFESDYCYWPAGKSEGGMDIVCSERPDSDRFHAAHVAANNVAMQGLKDLPEVKRLPRYNEAYLREMEKRGIRMRKRPESGSLYPTSVPEGGLW